MMRKLLTLWIALAAVVTLSSPPSNAAEFSINIGEATSDRVIVVALACKGLGAGSVSSNGIHLRRAVADASAGETLELWSGLMPTGSGKQTFAIAGCSDAKTTFWRLGDLKSAEPIRVATGDSVKAIGEPDCCVVSLISKAAVAAIYR
jgi:hypothetical protein